MKSKNLGLIFFGNNELSVFQVTGPIMFTFLCMKMLFEVEKPSKCYRF